MKKILAGILALTACCVFTSCDLLPSSNGTGTNNNGGGLGNLGGGENGGGTTTIVGEKVADETAWKNAFDGIENHYTMAGEYVASISEEKGGTIFGQEIIEWREIAKGQEIERYSEEGFKENGVYSEDVIGRGYLKSVDDKVYSRFETTWFHGNGEYDIELEDWILITDYYDWEEDDYIDESNGISWSDLAQAEQWYAFLLLVDTYNAFTYNQQEKVYVYQSTASAGFDEEMIELLESLELWEEEIDKLSCKIWIQNGKVSKLEMEAETYEYYDYGEEDWCFEKCNIEYQFGVGEPNLPEFVMPENTQVENETAWQNAFDGLHTHFTLDVKMEIPYTYDDTTKTDYAETVTMTIIAKGDEMSEYSKEFYLYEDGTVIDDYWSEYYLKKVDGTYYQWFRNWVAYGEFTGVGEWEEPFPKPDYANWNDYLPNVSMMPTGVFADKYELFTYDETEKAYVYNGNVQTGFSEMAESAFDNTGFGLDDAETLCYKVWIKDGKVVKVYVEMKCLDGYDETEQASYTPWLYLTYTFGVGEPDLPEFVMPE